MITKDEALQLAAQVCTISPNERDFWSASPPVRGNKWRGPEKDSTTNRRAQRRRREKTDPGDSDF